MAQFAVHVASGLYSCKVLNKNSSLQYALLLGNILPDLDFIPIVQEQYDIIIPAQYRNEYLIENVLETMKSQHYRGRVSGLGGYDPSRSGEFWMDRG